MGRNRISIMAEMLDVAKNGAAKMKIMQGANLSLRQLNTFLTLLMENGMLKEEQQALEIKDEIRDVGQDRKNTAGKFYTTPKGFAFLEKFGTLKELFANMDGAEVTGGLEGDGSYLF